MKQAGVYAITHTSTGKCYVGSTVNLNKRRNEHFGSLRRGDHHSLKLQRAWNNYGETAFKFEVLVRCVITRRLIHEQLALDTLRPAYNIATVAGAAMQGRAHSAATREKIRRSAMGNTRALGIVRSASTRALMSGAQRGNIKTRGHKLTPEHREKIGAAQRGRKLSTKRRARLSVIMRGNSRAAGVRTPEQCERIRAGRWSA